MQGQKQRQQMKRMTACHKKIKIHMITKPDGIFKPSGFCGFGSIIVKLNIFCDFYAIAVFI